MTDQANASAIPPGEGTADPAAPSPVAGDGLAESAAQRPTSASPMELLIRLRPSVADERHHDVVVSLDADHRIDELLTALSQSVGAGQLAERMRLTSIRTAVELDSSATVGEVDLVSGDELILDLVPPEPVPATTSAAMPPIETSSVALDVIAGPDSGRSHVLRPGRFVLGRRAAADISIDDPSVSRHHVDIVVDRHGYDDWQVAVHPVPDAANGVTVNDHPIDGPTPLTAADVVGLGGTRLAIRRVERPLTERVDRLGQIDFHRTPYRPTVVGEREAAPIGPIPERPEPRRLQIFAVLAPLAAGVMMYSFTKQVTFLALTLISPIVMIANAVDDRRTGRRRFRKDLAEFRDALIGTRADFEQLRHDERIDRLRSAPDLADLIRRAELRTIDLWSRGRDAVDALTVRLGLGSTTVRFPIELDRGGDDDLRDEALAAVDGLGTIDNVPVTVDLVADPVLGLHGESGLVDGVTASLVVQAATLHSPEDLTIVAAVAPERGQAWMKWLPHLRSVTSPMSGNHLAFDRDAADALVRRLVEIAHLRTNDRGESFSMTDEVPVWPRILLVLDDELGLDPAELSRLLDTGPAAGISVIWLATTAAGVPRQASRVLDVRRAPGAAMVGRLWSTDPDVADCTFELEHLRRPLAERAARALAPVRDASTASLATSIPRAAPLLDVLGTGKPSSQWIVDRWQSSSEYDLRFEIGMGVDGPLELDLVNDGPHTLIGGTSGAGKSELLQSMVAALAARYSPNRLNFLFVDYKGGASSQVFERLPHTVGYVTNLSADLSLRALTSLRAELDRRMAVLEGRAKDLEEMLERFPDEAPASLVIVVDEFATLVKEVPEFVTGIIDIAQRGRSLGIHLVLATQRPSGSVNENILANTNLRISLRMLDRTESSAIIDSPDAADIPVPLRGRALARLGPRRLVEFQSAFAGASVVSGETRSPVLVAPFDRTDASPRQMSSGSGSGDDDPTTHLEVLLDAIVDADAALSMPAPRRPWREVLPELVTLDQVRADDLVHGTPDSEDDGERATASPGRFVTIGLIDAPEQQAQHPAIVDLENGGGWLIFGSGGSGKTTLLRSVAASIGADASSGEVAVIAFDFASRGLMGLTALPEVVDVATGDDLEAVTRRFTQLDAELEHRRRLLADAGAEHLTAYHRDHPEARRTVPRIVVLIDSFGGLQSTLMESSGSVSMAAMEEWGERVQRLVIDGRQVGIHTVITADRRNAVPSRIHAAIGNRLILRHADENGYAEHAITGERAKNLDLSPGRGLLDGTTLVQIASVSADPAARAQQTELVALAERFGRPASSVLASSRLPEQLADPVVTDADDAPYRAVLGVADISGAPVVVDLDWSHVVISGPARSGRSTAALAMVQSLGAHHDLTVVGPSSSPLARWVAGLPGTDPSRMAFGRPDELTPVLDRLANQVAMGGCKRPPVLVIDDTDALDDPGLAALWDRLIQLDDLRIVMALEQRSMSGYTTSAVVNAARRARRLVVLQPDDPADFLQVTGVRLPTRPGLRMVPGRAVLLADRQPTILQVPAAP